MKPLDYVYLIGGTIATTTTTSFLLGIAGKVLSKIFLLGWNII